MQREASVQALDSVDYWDLVIVGGGAAGLGCALEATQRGYKTLLLEKGGIASGTSSRSSKMIHGGVRYLKQGDLSMVRLSLRERQYLLQGMPDMVKRQEFVIPVYTHMDAFLYRVGMKVYDLLAHQRDSYFLRSQETMTELPGIRSQGIKGGIVYSDGVFDDTRFAITLAYAADKAGATLINHAPLVGLAKDAAGKIAAVKFCDQETGREYEARCRCVINAAGTYADEIRSMLDPAAPGLQTISQGSHLVLPLSFLGKGDVKRAMMVPRTTDNRVLFCLPWHNRLLVGTTDIRIDKPSARPVPTRAEMDFILQNCASYLKTSPSESDILSAFAGQRALPGKGAKTRDISREYQLETSPAGMVSILGGKWTTYRVTAAGAVDRAQTFLKSANKKPKNDGAIVAQSFEELDGHLADLCAADKEHSRLLHSRLPYSRGEIVRALRYEMARTLTDLLAGHTRSVMLDRASSLKCAESVADLAADVLGRDTAWKQRQLKEFFEVAEDYRLPD